MKGSWQRGSPRLGAGALFVPIAQPKARLVMALLEPQAPDSLVAWGFFNTAFEQKEYMENYVAEDVARQMLAQDPALQASSSGGCTEDAAFAGSPADRLEFFPAATRPGTSASACTPLSPVTLVIGSRPKWSSLR